MVAIHPSLPVTLGTASPVSGTTSDHDKPASLQALGTQAQLEGDEFAISELGMPPEYAKSFADLPFTNRDGAPIDTSRMRPGMEEIFVKRLMPLVSSVFKQNLQTLAEQHHPESAAEWEQVREQAWHMTMCQKDVTQAVERMIDEGAELVSVG